MSLRTIVSKTPQKVIKKDPDENNPQLNLRVVQLIRIEKNEYTTDPKSGTHLAALVLSIAAKIYVFLSGSNTSDVVVNAGGQLGGLNDGAGTRDAKTNSLIMGADQSREQEAEITGRELTKAQRKLREQAAESERRQREQAAQFERERAAESQRRQREQAEAERQKAAEEKKKMEKLLDEPWRKNQKNGWTDTEVSAMREEVAGFEIPEDSGVEHFNILLLGTPSSGKTSLRNTVGSAFVDKILKLAFSGQAEKSLTKILKAYPIRTKTEGSKKKLSIKFWDTMGLDDSLQTRTICKILDGKVKHDTKLEDNLEDVVTRSESEIEIKHKMHCILFVVNATKLAALGETLLNKIQEITTQSEERGLPSMLVLTHVDKICPHVSKDTSTMFKSPRIRELVEKDAVEATSFPAYKIHPIRNYTAEGIKDTSIDFLTLLLMTQVMECCEEYCDYLEDSKEDY